MKTIMAARRGLYFSNFMRAFDELGLPSIPVVVDNFEVLSARMAEATRYRNKIFHGQLTGVSLDTERLLSLEADVRGWCKSLAVGADARFGYDGFYGFTSFFKGDRTEIIEAVDVKLKSLDDYDGLLRQLERLR
ncbi:hypothetical protein [Sinorhizobium meliloti]|uniref:hypothetical protein n=1 Tax=Rhizobium meliloti TaxID=382 RepID=UPI000FDC60C7|nr:hypothetical protein [Sinorhizobium meliloti]RVN37949.1 hypothetical protein CN118_14340 [Sinorhizobium meliloti]